MSERPNTYNNDVFVDIDIQPQYADAIADTAATFADLSRFTVDRFKVHFLLSKSDMAQTFKTFARGAPVLGGGIASTEIAMLRNDMVLKAEDADLITPETKLKLYSVYGYHVVQSAADPTFFGGEVVTKGALEKLEQHTEIDAAMLETVSPSLVVDMIQGIFSGEDLSARQLQELREKYAPEKIKDMHAHVIDKFGLPENVTLSSKKSHPIGLAVIDEQVSEKLIEDYPEFERGIGALRYINHTAANAYDLIQKTQDTALATQARNNDYNVSMLMP